MATTSMKMLPSSDQQLIGVKRNRPLFEEDSETESCSKKGQTFSQEESLELRERHLAKSAAKLDYPKTVLKITRARGQYMYGEDGTEYLDMRNNVHHVGHCHPKVSEAGGRQMSLLNTNSRFLHDDMLLLCKKFTKFLPEDLSVFFFANSGSEANDLALQIAEKVTGGTDIISVKGGYHGHLKSLRAISTHPSFSGEEASDYAHIVPLPDVYRGKFRDPATAGQLYAHELKECIESSTTKGKKIAGFIVEPIICCGGQIVPPEGYLKTAFNHVRSVGGLCIADEIQSGFGRVGSHFWAFEQQGVVPDIITIGKPMGNGHPVAAVITTKEIADKFAATGIEYFNTFGGNPVSMAIAATVLDVLEEENLQENAQRVGSYLMKELRALQEIHDTIGDVRGSGLMVGVEFVKDRVTKEPATQLAKVIRDRLMSDCHILTLTDGLCDNVLKLKPPLCIMTKDVDNFVSSLNVLLSASDVQCII